MRIKRFTSAFLVLICLGSSLFGQSNQNKKFANIKTLKQKQDRKFSAINIQSSNSKSIASPYSTGFEGTFPPNGWSIINNDGGSYTWEQSTLNPYNGEAHASVSYETPNDDWLITPQIVVGDNDEVIFMARSRNDAYPESFNVLVSKTTADVELFTIVLGQETGIPAEYLKYSYDLTANAEINSGDEIFIAIQCVSNNQYNLYVDDFRLPGPNDAGISELISPELISEVGETNVSVHLVNDGTASLTSATIQWELNGITQTSYNWNGSITPGQGTDVSIGTAGLVAGANALKIWVENPNGEADGSDLNDTLDVQVLGQDVGLLYVDFENEEMPPAGWSTSNPGGTYFWENWNDTDWGGFGFIMDNQYAGIMSSSSGSIDTLYMPQLALNGSINELAFLAGGYNNTIGAGGATLQVIYSSDSVTWNEAFSIDLTQGETLDQYIVDLSPIPYGIYYFAFAVTNTFDYYDYISIVGIDNVVGPEIADLGANDLRVANIEFPTDFVYHGNETTLTVEIQNVGLDDQSDVEFNLLVDGNSVFTGTTGTLSYAETEIVDVPWAAIVGRHTFTAILADDENADNNEFSIQGVVTGEGLLTAGFEDGVLPEGWQFDTNENWQIWVNGFTDHYEGVNAIAAGNMLNFSDAILSTHPVVLTGTEELNFYATVGNPTVGDYGLDIVYSEDGETWSEVVTGIEPTISMELYTIDLGIIPTGSYHLGFRASGSGDGEYATWIVVDHIVGPALTTQNISSVLENKISLYPNPVGELLTVSAKEVGTIEVINAVGQKLFTSDFNGEHLINVTNYQTGVYFVIIHGRNAVHSTSFIVN